MLNIASWDVGGFAKYGLAWAENYAHHVDVLQRALGPHTTLLMREVIPVNKERASGSLAPDVLLPNIVSVNARLRQLLHADNTTEAVLLPILDWSAGPVQHLHRTPCAVSNYEGNHMELWAARRLELFQVVYALQNLRSKC